MIWALPAVVAFVATIALFFAIRVTAADAKDLIDEINTFAEVRRPVLALRAEALALQADALELAARRRAVATSPLPARPELGSAS